MNGKEEMKWEDLIQSYRNSGMGLEKGCDSNHVSKSSMRYHLYAKKINTSSMPQLIEMDFDECLIQPFITIKLGKLEVIVDRQIGLGLSVDQADHL